MHTPHLTIIVLVVFSPSRCNLKEAVLFVFERRRRKKTNNTISSFYCRYLAREPFRSIDFGFKCMLEGVVCQDTHT